ncbi:MAG: ATP-binding protein [Sulfitobacter sp.]
MHVVENFPNPSAVQQDEAATLRTLNAFAVDVMYIPNAEELFWYVAQNVVGRLKFVDCVIYQANPEQTELVQVAALGGKNPFGRNILNPLKIPFGEGITGTVAQTRKAMVVDDLASDQTYIPDTQLARSEICVPLVAKGRVVGVIDCEHPEPGSFGEAELEILTTVAAMTSAKLELLEEAGRSRQRYSDLMHSHTELTQETNNRKALEVKLFESRKLEAIGRLSGRFAHEFNNLLTVISGNLELLEIDQKESVSVECLEDARLAAKRGAVLIEDMLAFSQRARLKQETYDLNKLVFSVIDQHQAILKDEISLEAKLSDDLWLVKIDSDATGIALSKLISNAQDTLPDGGLIEIRTENFFFDLSKSSSPCNQLCRGRYVCLSVTDNGAGIPQDQLAQIFDPFFTTKAVGAGSGMGLSFVHGFMKQIGGALEVTSKEHEGSTFRMFFPAFT